MSISSYSLEYSCLYRDGKPFSARIADESSLYDPSKHEAAMVSVDLSLTSLLKFDEAAQTARQIQEQGGKIVWDLELGIQDPLYFEGIFNAHYHALKIFTQDLYSVFQESTLGCSLFRGECDFASRILWNERHYQNFLEWLVDVYGTPEELFEAPLGEAPLGSLQKFEELSLEMFDVTPFCRHLKNIHSAHAYAAYFHRLAAALPEELFVFLCLDARYSMHPAYLYQLLSKERFSHLQLAVKGAPIFLDALVWKEGVIESQPQYPSVGVCFPNDPYCKQSTLHQFKKVLMDLKAQGIAYRIIPEFLMTSSWEGIDEMIVLQRALSPQGKRILQGFSITGGKMIYIDSALGFEEEISWNEFLEGKNRGRGI